MKRKLPIILTLAFLILIVCIVTVANLDMDVFWLVFIRNTNGGDKVGHFLLFGVMALLTNWTFKYRGIRWPWLQLGALLVFSFAALEEVTQIWIDNRTFDYWDLLMDFSGIAVFTAAGLVLRRNV